MAVTKLWTNWAVKLHTETAQAGGKVMIHGIRTVALNSGLRTQVETGDGSVYASFGSLVSGAQVCTVETSDLKTLFDALGITGMKIDSGLNPGVVVYGYRMTTGGTRDALAAGTHHATTVTNGIAVLRSLSLPNQGPAVATFELYARKESATEPLTFSETANLDAGVNPVIDTLWTMGPVKLNATVLSALDSVQIDFGVQVVCETRDSDIYPTFCGIRSIQPRITLNGVHIDDTATLTEDGTSFAASLVTLYARKRAEGGTFVADVTAEHIKLTLGKCRVDWDQISGDPRSLSMVITPWDTPGGVAPLAINTASAIT